jgi:hypothetical protein
VQQHLGRLEGVDKVDVSLADGTVVILAKEDSQLDPAKVFKATYDSGVSVAEMTVEATGSFERDRSNALVFRVSGNLAYPVTENDIVKPFSEMPSSEKVFVHAQVYKKTGKQKLKALRVVRFEVLEVRKQP